MYLKSLLFFSLRAVATTLYASHYDGHIFTLSLSDTNDSLTLTNALQACGLMPSWLTLDRDEHTLYCVDESGTKSSGNGSVSSFAVSANGSLTDSTVDVTTMPGGVASVVYQAAGKKFLAIAHYSGAAISTFQLPLSSESKPYQVFAFELTAPTTDPSRQDTPHPHHVLLDPTGKYLLSPDLGADLIRIFAIDATDGKLRECNPANVTGGTGPRHGAFYPSSSSSSPPSTKNRIKAAEDSSTKLYVTNELANTLSTFAVNYPASNDSNDSNDSNSGCLSLSALDEMTPYPSTPLPSNAYVSEIRIPDNDSGSNNSNIYVSIRSDQGFSPNDSMATLELASEDKPAFKNLSSSYGTVPRTFALSPDGSMVAIGDQASSNVAIIARNTATGELGQLLGSVQIGSQGQPGQSNGLSSVVWG